MGDVHLDMVGYVGWRALQKVCQTVFHQLHEENGLVGGGVLDHTQELDNVGVFQVSQDLALLLKSRDEVRESGVLGVHDDSVEDFSSTWVFIQCCLYHIAIGSGAQDLNCVDHYILVAIETSEAQTYVIWILGLEMTEKHMQLQTDRKLKIVFNCIWHSTYSMHDEIKPLQVFTALSALLR